MNDKLPRDRAGEIYQDELTENQSKPRPPRRDDAAHDEQLDPNVDSQEADQAMSEGRFAGGDRQRSQP